MQVGLSLWEVTGFPLQECLKRAEGPFPFLMASGVSQEDAERIRSHFAPIWGEIVVKVNNKVSN